MRRRDVSRSFLAILGALAVSAALAGYASAESGFATLPSRDEIAKLRNWTGARRDGSCVWASLGLMCVHAGLDDAANRIRRSYAGAANDSDVDNACRQLGIPAQVVRGKEGFLRLETELQAGRWVAMTWTMRAWCTKCRRWEDALHVLNAVGISADGKYWAILDNNNLTKLRRITRDKAWEEYTSGYGWGIVMEASR